MYAPNGKRDGTQILPLSEIATRDDFFNIKKFSRDDLLSARLVPLQTMGIIPDNDGGFGLSRRPRKSSFGMNWRRYRIQ